MHAYENMINGAIPDDMFFFKKKICKRILWVLIEIANCREVRTVIINSH